MKLDLDSIEVLDAVVRHGSVARAAAALNKAHSAISYHLRQLEARLGLPLINRDEYRLSLTAAGALVLEEGRRLLEQARRIEALTRDLSKGWEASLSIIYDGSLPMQSLWDALKTVADEGTPTRIGLKVEFLGGVQYRYEHDGADLMLVKDYVHQPHLNCEAMPEIENVLCASPTHSLASESHVNLQQLRSFVELSIQDSSGQGNDRHTFAAERTFYLSDFNSKRDAILRGLGYGWLPRHLADGDLASGRLVELNFPGGSRYRFTPFLVWRVDRPLQRTGKRLTELLREKLETDRAPLLFR